MAEHALVFTTAAAAPILNPMMDVWGIRWGQGAFLRALLWVGIGSALFGLAGCGGEEAVQPAALGVAWHGSINGVTDFSFESPSSLGGSGAGQIDAMDATLWTRGESGSVDVRVELDIALRKVKVRLLDADGDILRLLDGVYSSDGRLVGGLAYEPGDDPGEGGALWWATVELTSPEAPSRVNLNDVSIGALREVLDEPRDAWPVVEYRLREEGYESLDDLDDVDVSSATTAQLMEIAHVR